MDQRPVNRRVALAIPAALTAALAIAVVVPTATATTASSAEASIIAWINDARISRGLVPYRTDRKLLAITGLRASRMAASNRMTHTVGGNLSSQITSSGLRWYRYGEDIGWSTASWPTSSARSIFRAWMNSPAHRAMILSDRFNYVGVGLAYRSSNRKTFGSAIFAETNDRTRPLARVTRATRSGDTIRWSWSGHDPRLQTHTAGLRNYDVLYRVGSGNWVYLRNNTTSTSVVLTDRPGGRSYSIRVRATDRGGMVGVWSRESRIWVP